MSLGCPYGTHRVLKPLGVLPQPAETLNNDFSALYDNEILIDVEVLNIDSASFTQIKTEAGGLPEKIAQIILKTVAERGKQHNPVTGSGGMLIGKIKAIGSALQNRPLNVGDRIATLVSLSLTPLHIEEILAIHKDVDQVEIRGEALLFESGIYVKLPDDMPQKLALAVLDVAGAPAQTAKIVKPGDTVVVIGGGGKSGLLCLHEACKRAGVTGKVIGISQSSAGVKRMKESGLPLIALQGDACDSLWVLREIEGLTEGKLADLTLNMVNIPRTELGSILATRDKGIVYFFSMATSFTAAALGAEGIGKDVTMLVGNGYTEGHAEIALAIMRENPRLRELYERTYA
ncbi:L-erythro-3,5-diaminohexanoate dehydrogenase [Desulfosporosinus sp. BICA1-9]|uniref:L-erythro-3,5-diaminohexanoate dehydrogenase n=1 Tax=Desulfosporosinus sp. BICA1-9 TaxID=1531958 RepID=UPI00054C6404|nr:L-erythro-3,5-diaminohexanoate dehydrogenase [Desulfosporosinus sp. BICA1-9]KJS49424.1 MAG: L-erythro-3,5-diaminohexanoate dehydrogenase [Peptococcaceae bacterium BRH_c23]KJS79995.1 MAG: L-erythro-3,5-diaminohexanoate dehydrogenase [Desulfosporosinus sp. BICA1-9]HBW33992.1 L-erythro-3,5-diaminohexanoate dehydrogenase [Desulfosporosinus sp.]